MWLIIFGSIIIATAAGVIYMTAAVRRFHAVEVLSGGRKLLSAVISFLIIAFFFALACLLFSFMNAMVILLHVMLFFLLFGLILRLLKGHLKEDSSVNRQGWLAIVTAFLYLIIAWVLCHHVWQKDYTLTTDKPVEALRVAMIADSHIGTTFDGEGFAAHIKKIGEQSPDMLLIAGDFVDDASCREDMLRACRALGELELPYGVFYAYGNHDKGYANRRDFTAEELKDALLENGVHVLEDASELIDDRFYIVGRKDSAHGERKDMAALLAGLDQEKYIIVMDHEPNDYENEAASAADLVVSGHTHGGQLIPITYVGEWFHINDRTYGHENRSGTDFIVTSGISDWEILFKTGTRSEYVIIDITSEN
ncbi:MAG: metallophosphoesterase [Lachnospiraceae bacterium]|nr:metallophosphoesterase [Lachnospiraceae bacterium]